MCGVCTGVRKCAQVCAGMHECTRVCMGVCRCCRESMGVCGCARVWLGVHGYAWVCAIVWDEFSEFLLENRVPTSADFNTYPIQIFLFLLLFPQKGSFLLVFCIIMVRKKSVRKRLISMWASLLLKRPEVGYKNSNDQATIFLWLKKKPKLQERIYMYAWVDFS